MIDEDTKFFYLSPVAPISQMILGMLEILKYMTTNAKSKGSNGQSLSKI